MNFLLVDDSEADNYLHSRALMKHFSGCCIQVATSGQESLRVLTSRAKTQAPRFNLLVLDINMPGIDGWEFLKRYEKLDTKAQAELLVLMECVPLPSNLLAKAKANRFINQILCKPLDPAAVAGLQHLAKTAS